MKIIYEATKILRPLRNDVVNFVLFGTEIEENLMRLFEKHRNNQNLIERVLNSVMKLDRSLLKTSHRRLSSRNKAHNPWTVQITRDLPVQLLAFLLDMVKKASSNRVRCLYCKLQTEAVFFPLGFIALGS